MEFVLLIAGCAVYPTVYCISFYFASRILPSGTKILHSAISTRAVSLFQATCASCVGIQVILQCDNIMKDRFPSINNYAWFAVSYFYYDLGAMVLETYHTYPSEGLIRNCQRLYAKKHLVVLHHLLLPLLGFPVIVFYRDDKGDFFVACIYLAELSTPFLSIHVILKKFTMESSFIFKVNGLLLALSFFAGRILVFPYMYYSYARHAHLHIWEVPFNIPKLCNITCLGFLMLQLVWFIAILRRGARFLWPCWQLAYKEENYGTKSSSGQNTNNPFINSTLFTNGKQN